MHYWQKHRPCSTEKIAPQIWLTNFQLNVDLPHIAELLTVEIPLAIDIPRSKATVSLTEHLLTITCPIKSIAHVLNEVR